MNTTTSYVTSRDKRDAILNTTEDTKTAVLLCLDWAEADPLERNYWLEAAGELWPSFDYWMTEYPFSFEAARRFVEETEVQEYIPVPIQISSAADVFAAILGWTRVDKR